MYIAIGNSARPTVYGEDIHQPAECDGVDVFHIKGEPLGGVFWAS